MLKGRLAKAKDVSIYENSSLMYDEKITRRIEFIICIFLIACRVFLFQEGIIWSKFDPRWKVFVSIADPLIIGLIIFLATDIASRRLLGRMLKQHLTDALYQSPDYFDGMRNTRKHQMFESWITAYFRYDDNLASLAKSWFQTFIRPTSTTRYRISTQFDVTFSKLVDGCEYRLKVGDDCLNFDPNRYYLFYVDAGFYFKSEDEVYRKRECQVIICMTDEQLVNAHLQELCIFRLVAALDPDYLRDVLESVDKLGPNCFKQIEQFAIVNVKIGLNLNELEVKSIEYDREYGFVFKFSFFDVKIGSEEKMPIFRVHVCLPHAVISQQYTHIYGELVSINKVKIDLRHIPIVNIRRGDWYSVPNLLDVKIENSGALYEFDFRSQWVLPRSAIVMNWDNSRPRDVDAKVEGGAQ